MISNNYRQFRNFSHFLGQPIWRGKTILDFGGNCGNFLTEASELVEPQAVAEGRRRHPTANWLFYDRFNFEFNPGGTRDLPIPQSLPHFDYILAGSVFTHTAEREMLDLVAQLRDRLRPSGRLLFTFMDPHFVPASPVGPPAQNQGNVPAPDCNLYSRLIRRLRVNPLFAADAHLARAAGCETCSLIDDDFTVSGEEEREQMPGDQSAYEIFYTSSYLQRLFPSARLLEPPPGERQHGCLLARHSL
jgi:SAM-dependent methyltransferase